MTVRAVGNTVEQNRTERTDRIRVGARSEGAAEFLKILSDDRTRKRKIKHGTNGTSAAYYYTIVSHCLLRHCSCARGCIRATAFGYLAFSTHEFGDASSAIIRRGSFAQNVSYPHTDRLSAVDALLCKAIAPETSEPINKTKK